MIADAGFARYLPDERLLFVRGGLVYTVGFDATNLAVRGTSEVLLDAIRYDWRNGGSHLAVSAAGVLVYGPGQPSVARFLPSRGSARMEPSRGPWIRRAGSATSSECRRPEHRRRAGYRRRLDLWSVDAGGTLSRLSFELSPYRPTWTANGRDSTVGARKDGKWRLLHDSGRR